MRLTWQTRPLRGLNSNSSPTSAQIPGCDVGPAHVRREYGPGLCTSPYFPCTPSGISRMGSSGWWSRLQDSDGCSQPVARSAPANSLRPASRAQPYCVSVSPGLDRMCRADSAARAPSISLAPSLAYAFLLSLSPARNRRKSANHRRQTLQRK